MQLASLPEIEGVVREIGDRAHCGPVPCPPLPSCFAIDRFEDYPAVTDLCQLGQARASGSAGGAHPGGGRMSGAWVLRLRECETLRREERRLRCGPRLGALLSPAYLHASEVIVRVSADLV